MYTVGNVVLFNGEEWQQGNFGNETVNSLLTRSTVLYVTVTDEQENIFLVSRDILKTLTGSMSLTSVINAYNCVNKVAEHVELKKHRYSFLPVKKVESLSVLLDEDIPFVFSNNACMRTIETGNHWMVPDLVLEMSVNNDFTMGTFSGLANTKSSEFKWELTDDEFNRSLLKIGNKLVALRQLFVLCGKQLKLRKNYRLWFVDLFVDTLERIPAHDVGISYPLVIDNLVKMDTIKSYFAHRNVTLFIIDSDFPVELSSKPISDFSGELLDGAIFENDNPTTHRVIGFKYHNELVRRKRLLPDDTYKTYYKPTLTVPDVALKLPEYRNKHLVTLKLPAEL